MEKKEKTLEREKSAQSTQDQCTARVERTSARLRLFVLLILAGGLASEGRARLFENNCLRARPSGRDGGSDMAVRAAER